MPTLRGLPRSPRGIPAVTAATTGTASLTSTPITVLDLRVPWPGWWMVFVHVNATRVSGAQHSYWDLVNLALVSRLPQVFIQIGPTTNTWWWITTFHATLRLDANDLLVRLRGSVDASSTMQHARMTAIPVDIVA